MRTYWDQISKETKTSLNSSLNSTMELENERFNMISTAYLFTVMGYLSKSSADSHLEKRLFYDLWALLKGEQAKGATFDVIKIIILTIHGLYKGQEDAKESGKLYN